MKVNVKLDLNDNVRNLLADYIDDKTSNRLATRKDVNSFVQGCIHGAYVKDLGDELQVTVEAEIQRLRDLGYDDSYIRGWLQVGRSCA